MTGAAFALLCAPAPAPAQAPTDIGTVNANAPPAPLDATPEPGSAADLAPSRPPLNATQPTSVVGPNFIRNSVTPTENYDDIIKFSPSVQNVEPVGSGLQQNFLETIRGFQYTQFNTTFDGIVLPGLPTNFAPQSEAYFMAHDIGSVEIDRGPGTASTLGYATFGGTVSIRSTTPKDTLTINPYATYGSYDTKLYGIQLDTGIIPNTNGVRGFLDVEREEALGALSGTATERRNLFSKFEVPVGDNTVITFVGMFDNDYNHTPYGTQAGQLSILNRTYSLNNDPTSQAFAGYNYDVYATDFDYVGVKSDLGDGWGLDNKTYTNGYYQRGSRGLDVNGTTPNLNGNYYVSGVRLSLSNAVPGYQKHNDFRDYGDILRITKDTEYGQIRTGVWVDYLVASSYRYSIVLNDGYQPYVKSPTGTPYAYDYHTSLTTVQPYLEYAINPLPVSLPGLTITPGLKYTATTRGLDALVNNSTKLPANFNETYDALQPSIDARYVLMPGWVVYAQTAKGFLAPPLNVLYTTSPQSLSPQETWNYQAGTTFQNDRFSLGADVYYIDFKNRIASQTIGGTAIFSNGGGAIYKGIEFEGTAKIAYGVSAYGNYTLNDGNYVKHDAVLAVTPRNTAAAGLIYQRQGLAMEDDALYGSIIGKFVGPQYLQDANFVDLYPIHSYSYADLAVGYTFPVWEHRKLQVKLNVNNLFDNRSIIGLAGTAGDGVTPLYWVNAGRSFFLTLSATL
jgi:iron complex outermembrane receptor protein